MKILIINLTRLGDIVQSISLVSGLKKKYPSANIYYLAFKGFSTILKQVEFIDSVITMDDEALYGNIKDNFWISYHEVQNCIDKMNLENFDLVINPIADVRSSLIASNISKKDLIGFSYNSNYEYQIKNKWPGYHLASERIHGQRNFNLVDVFARSGGVKADFKNYSIGTRKEPLPDYIKLKKNTSSRIIGFHIGASRSNKAWEPEKFYQVITRLLQKPNYKIILLGGKGELPLKKMFDGINHSNFYNLIGETNLEQLIYTIEQLDIMVTNDTGPMHIACALKRTVLNISLGPVSFWETGPYCESCLIVEADISCRPCSFKHQCDHLKCHNIITPEFISEAIVSFLDNSLTLAAPENVKLWKSKIDCFGLLHYVPFFLREIKQQELFFEIKRLIWALTICLEQDDFSQKEAVVRMINNYFNYLENYYDMSNKNLHLSIIYSDLKESISGTIDIIKNIIQSLENCKNEKNIDRIKSLFNHYNTDKRNLELLIMDKLRTFRDFFDFVNFRESAVESDDLGFLLNETLRLYKGILMQFSILLEIIRS